MTTNCAKEISNMNAPKVYEWTEYVNSKGEPAARAMRVFDAVLWQVWTWNSDKTAGYWNTDVAVVRDIPTSHVAEEAHIDSHKKIEGVFQDLVGNVRELRSGLSMLGDLVDHMNERTSFAPDDFKPRLRDRLR